jgi:hypothetical protein
MKKIHWILLIITVTLAVFSVYSLAAINQVYKIDFKWYSQYNRGFTDEVRAFYDEKWVLSKYPGNMITEVFPYENSLTEAKVENLNKILKLTNIDFQNDILIYCTLGSVDSPEYKIKVIDIAQRGNVVEVKLSLNSPDKLENHSGFSKHGYLPFDIIKISKDAFVTKGRLFFIFKNQAGNKIGESNCII